MKSVRLDYCLDISLAPRLVNLDAQLFDLFFESTGPLDNLPRHLPEHFCQLSQFVGKCGYS